MGSVAGDEVTMYIKAGVDGERMGACPFCQRVFMALLIKAQHNLLKFKVVNMNEAKPPPEFKSLGLRHAPAIIHGDESIDAVEDILQYLDARFPGGGLEYSNVPAELATKNIFSKFCFYIKAINQESNKLDAELQKFNSFLEQNPPASTNSEAAQSTITESPAAVLASSQFLCGDRMTHLDCEVLPKLHHLRVAAKALKKYDIPANLRGFWRYLHAAYSNPIFVQSCPSDQEIILHWHDRAETPKLPHKQHCLLSKEAPKFSFDVPVHASLVTLVE